MLHHPFREINDLLNREGGEFDTWIQVYEICLSTDGRHEPDGLPKKIQIPEDDEFEDNSNNEDANLDDDLEGSWQETCC
jgi:hypothetical protein